MHNKRCKNRLQHRPTLNDFSPLQQQSCYYAVFQIFSFIFFFRRSTVLLQRKKALYRCLWRKTSSKSFCSLIIFLILGTQVSYKSYFVSGWKKYSDHLSKSMNTTVSKYSSRQSCILNLIEVYQYYQNNVDQIQLQLILAMINNFMLALDQMTTYAVKGGAGSDKPTENCQPTAAHCFGFTVHSFTLSGLFSLLSAQFLAKSSKSPLLSTKQKPDTATRCFSPHLMETKN